MSNSTPPPLPISVVSVKFIDGTKKGTTYPIHKPVTTIGHELSKDIIVQGISSAPEFARIIEDNGSWRIERRSQDLIVKVNNQIVAERATLHDGDTIDFGPVVAGFLFENPFEKNGGTYNYLQGPTTPLTEPLLEVTSNISPIRAKYTLPISMQVINIGRNPANDIVIDQLFVDPLHLQIIRENAQLKLIHPPSHVGSTTHGIWYQDTHIQGTEQFEHILSQGDAFHIKNEYGTRITLTYDDGSNAAQQNQPGNVQANATILLDGKQQELIIGRQPGSNILLAHPSIARRHARVVLDRRGRHHIIDESGLGNVYVNGRQAKNQQLQFGDEIRIGPYRLVYANTELAEYDERNSIRIDAYDLEKRGVKEKLLLNGISLAVEPGKFIALVGGSGAGKSTLMDALNGLRPAQKGHVYYNGQDYYSSLAAFRTQLGYVPQEDIVHLELSVERALYYVARLRLPGDLVQQRIETVLKEVSLQSKRHLLVKQLSGGQKKRVSIALELLAEPSIFFLDEPTSGLDPGLDHQMMALLRELADKGHTIVLVTHATNNINNCDYVCFLCRDGRMAYFGPPRDAPAYFGKTNFAEIYSSLEPPDEQSTIPQQAEDKFKQSNEYEKYVKNLLKPPHAAGSSSSKPARKLPKQGSYWKQLFLLSLRYLELLKNDPFNLAILLLQAPLIGLLLLGFIYFVGRDGFNPNTILQCPTTAAIINVAGYPDPPSPTNPIVSKSCQHVKDFLSNTPRGKAYASKKGGVNKALQDFILPGTGYASTILFIMAFAAIMFGCINSAREFVKEAHIYRRERAVNLGILPYMFSKILVLGLLCLLQSLILVWMTSIFDPFSHSVLLTPFWEIYITTALTSLAGLMMGLTVSALVPNNDRAMSVVPLLLLPQIIFSGTIFPLNSSWLLQIPAALVPIRWALAALGSSAGLHSDKLNGDQLFGNIDTYHSTLFSTYTQADATAYLWLTWLVLSCMIILFAIAIAFCLKRKDAYR
ncbi:MAG TPA: ATP-binding cassette domain-containing protein [Ktedonobacteraceae bacterium]|nr:ATP-binding cassette domain-containing protein [Ktedonobacteraceae bacterium]